MKSTMRAGVVGMMAVCAVPALAQDEFDNSVFYGGTIGLGFGDVDYVEIAPLIGRHVNQQFSYGGSVIYRHRSDDRYEKDLSTDDYGASIFGRYRLTPTLFAQAEYEYLNYEFYNLDLSKDRDSSNSVFLGGGISAPAGQNASMYATALYNVNYDEDESPYDSPWVIRFGVGVGF